MGKKTVQQNGGTNSLFYGAVILAVVGIAGFALWNGSSGTKPAATAPVTKDAAPASGTAAAPSAATPAPTPAAPAAKK